jgi:chromosome segregation ATPase
LQEPTVHVVTKILIVFCAVLSLLLAALTMAYASNAGEIRSNYKAEEAARITSETALKDGISQWETERAKLQTDLVNANNAVGDSEARVKGLEAERTELRTQLEQAKAAGEAVGNRIVQLTAATNTQAEEIKLYHDEVTKLRDDGLKASRREIELVDHINDLEAAREVLEQTVRAVREQLAEVQLAMQNIKSGNANDQGNEPFVHTGQLISARVLNIQKSKAGETLAEISEGSNRDIKPNMRMNIVRGDQFLGDLIILTVDPQRAVGRIVKLDPKAPDVQPQDRVLSSLQR